MSKPPTKRELEEAAAARNKLESTIHFRFVPRLPTKEAWENRMFKETIVSVKSLVKALYEKEKILGDLRGQLIYRPNFARFTQFANIHQMLEQMRATKSVADEVQMVDLYGWGFFWVNG